jgi:hypothetical protein
MYDYIEIDIFKVKTDTFMIRIEKCPEDGIKERKVGWASSQNETVSAKTG